MRPWTQEKNKRRKTLLGLELKIEDLQPEEHEELIGLLEEAEEVLGTSTKGDNYNKHIMELEIANKAYKNVLRGLPVMLQGMDVDKLSVFADLLQGMLDIGYQDGFKDNQK